MRNFIILQIQHYEPTNDNLKFIWDMLTGSQFDDVRKRIDPFFKRINANSSDKIQEQVFFKSFRNIVSHFHVTTRSGRIRGIEIMRYEESNEGHSKYKLLLSKRRHLYFSGITRIPDITIRDLETYKGNTI